MSSKHIALLTLGLLAGAMAGLLIWMISKKKADRPDIAQMPEITAVTLSGEGFSSSKELDVSKRTAIMFFHPECDYCRKELEGILARHGEMRNMQWVFMTIAPEEEVQKFLPDYPMHTIPDAWVLREEWPEMHQEYKVKGPPALFVYDENGQLFYEHRGAVSIKTIVEKLR